MLSTWPWSVERRIGVDIDRLTGWPGRMSASWLSLKFAVTQSSRRDDREELLAGRHVVAGFDIALGDPAVLRRRDNGPGQIEIGLIEPGLRLLDLTFELPDLRVGLADPLRHRRVLRRPALLPSMTCACACCSAASGGIDLLLRRRAVSRGSAGDRNRPAPWRGWPSPLQLRLRLLELRREILAGDLGAILQAGILAFRRRQRAFGLLVVDQILPWIDVDQRLALFDELVVVDVERDDGARIPAGRS